ncbi:MAG: hypothetical protein RL227_321, partial [Pseudomonadota bacterium]
GNVARWLVQAGDSGPAVAGHFEEAGLPQDAAEQLETAALRARRASRPAEEATLWERAAALWERLGRRAREFEALRESVRPRRLASGDIEAAATAEKLLSKALSPLEQCAAKFEQACVNVFMERPAEALAMLKQVREMAMAANAGAIVVEATIRVGVALNRLDRFAETLTLLEEVRPQLDLCGLGVRGLYLNTLIPPLFASHQLEQAVAISRERLALMEQGEEWRGAAFAATNLGFVLAECGRLEAARAVSERALHHLRRLGPVRGDAFADIEVNCSAVLASMGELGSALKALQRSEAYLKAAHGARLQGLLNQLMDHLAACHLLRNDAESAQGYLLQVVEDGSERVVEHARRRMIQAVVAAVQTRDPSNWLQQARDIAVGSSQEVLLDIEIDACAAWCGIGASDPQALLALEQRAWAIEQGGLATRLAWYRVDALRRSGNVAAAALRARELLDQPLWPTMLLPCHWLWIAQAALAAAGDPQAPAVAARASEAHAMTLKDLGSLPGPPRDWQLAAAGSAVLA